MGKILKLEPKKQQEYVPLMGVQGDFTPEELAAMFPFKWVRCETCGAYFCAREIYFITHAPPYEFRCPCGPQGLHLRWKIEKHQDPAPSPPETVFQKLRRWWRYYFRGD